jgi:hypothetical protein
MNRLILPLILVSVILISGCVTQKIGTKEGITVNTEVGAGVAASPMDLALSVSPFSEEREAEITVNIGKREDYPNNESWNTTAQILLPAGLELVEGNVNWHGTITGDEWVEFKVKVKAVQNGEWKVEAKARTPPTGDSWWGDIERFYVLIKDDEILVSEAPFTKPGGMEQERV